MPGANNSSFIPKGPSQVQFTKARTARKVYLFTYISYIIFFGTLIATALIYAYGWNVNRNLNNAKAELRAEQDKFNTTDVGRVRSLEKRLLLAEKLLSEKTAASLIFADIEKVVAENVQFVGFKYERMPNNELQISLTGKADDFNKALYQRDLLNNSNILKNSVISSYDYSLGQEDGSGKSLASGNVVLTFTFSDKLSAADIPYNPEVVVEESGLGDAAEGVVLPEGVTDTGVVEDGQPGEPRADTTQIDN